MWIGIASTIAISAILGFIIARNFDNTYTTKVVIDKPFDVVWSWVSDPLKYPKIYPNWVKTITKKSEQNYQVDDQFGGSYDIELIANKDYGIVDLQIGPEASFLRLYRLDEIRTVVIHLAKRWKAESFVIWFFHKITTDKDFKNAKKVIEGK